MSGHICLAVHAPALDLLERQLDSLRRQTLGDWTAVVGIDGDGDDVRRAVERLCGGDPRLHVVAFPDRVGHYRNFERLLASVPPGARWVALSDQDDDWDATKLETLVGELPTAALVQGEARIELRPQDGLPLAGGRARRQTDRTLAAQLVDNQVTGSFAVFRSDLLSTALPFPPPTDAAYHDHWLGLCAQATGGVRTVHEPLQTYVQHGRNVVGETRGATARWRALVRTGGTARARLDYVARHRFGWRVTMARELQQRVTVTSARDARTLRAFARGRLSAGLGAAVGAEAVRGTVSRGRAAVLLVGAAWCAARPPR